MLDLKTALMALRFMGFAQVFRSIQYAVRRDVWERRRERDRQEGEAVLPGAIRGYETDARGVLLDLEALSLDIHFLTDDFVRITWTPGDLPVPYALERTEWPIVDLKVLELPAAIRVESPALEIQIEQGGGIAFHLPGGELLRSEYPPRRSGERWMHAVELSPQAGVYGLGERSVGPNLRPGHYRLFNSDAGGSYGPQADPLYLSIPVIISFEEGRGCLVFFENSYEGSISIDERISTEFEGGALRYYVAFGSAEHLIFRYTQLTGRPPIPPRWALGYHQCRWGYRTEADIREVVQGFIEHDLPLSAVHFDIDYMDGYRVFSVDRSNFPDLPALIGELAQKEIHAVAILDPGVKVDPDYHVYTEGIAGGMFCKLPDGSLLRAPVWPGWCVFPDFSNPTARAWWGSQYARLLDLGVSGVWHDMNEPAAFAAWGRMTFPSVTQHDLDGRGGDHREAHNLYGLLMNWAGFDALKALRPERRPWLLSRSGWAGLQRYAWKWTGDTESSWDALRMTIATILNTGLSGIAYSGPDIGGFSHHPDKELYLRWFQLAAFLPFFRTHSATGTPAREPWRYDEQTLNIARRYLQLRYRLLPYFYTLAWEAHHKGFPLVRPLFWFHPGDTDLYAIDDAFMLGQALLVAPVVGEGLTKRTIRLPEGRWVDFWEDTVYEGPREIELLAPLQHLPLLVSAGSILPMEERECLSLHLYPPAVGECAAQVYMDAGDGYGPWRVEHLLQARVANILELTRTSEGDYPFPYEQIEIVLHTIRCERAQVDGRDCALDEQRLVLKDFHRIHFELIE